MIVFTSLHIITAFYFILYNMTVEFCNTDFQFFGPDLHLKNIKHLYGFISPPRHFLHVARIMHMNIIFFEKFLCSVYGMYKYNVCVCIVSHPCRNIHILFLSGYFRVLKMHVGKLYFSHRYALLYNITIIKQNMRGKKDRSPPYNKKSKFIIMQYSYTW